MPDGAELWDACLDLVRDRIAEQPFHTWFVRTRGLPDSDGVLRVSVPSRFAAEWLEGNYMPLIRAVVREVAGEDLPLEFVPRSEQVERAPAVLPEPQRAVVRPAPQRAALCQLNPRYTFDTFVVGASNEFAHAAALAVAETPGLTRYNPLFVYGGVGLGKTHIAQAIAHYVLAEHVGLRVMYATSEKFTNDFIEALQQKRVGEFSDLYRRVDMLIIDDVQFFNGKEATQEEFFHVFNALHQANKQIVLTADRAPKQIVGLEQRLLSRFSWGLVADVQPPDLETRIAILQKKADYENLSLPVEVLSFIAANITANIRELEGSLIRLLAHASLTRQEITLELTQRVLRDMIDHKTREVTVEVIQTKVAEAFGIPEDMMRARRKTAEIALPRQVAMYLARSLTKKSLKAIGGYFGGRDHSTVIHAVKTVEELLASDPQLKYKVDGVINALYN